MHKKTETESNVYVTAPPDCDAVFRELTTVSQNSKMCFNEVIITAFGFGSEQHSQVKQKQKIIKWSNENKFL